VDVEVDGPGEAFLMLWRLREAVEDATLDGRPAVVVPMAFGFAGARIPPGRHVLTLRPETRWVKIGALVTALTAAALALAWALRRRGPVAA
jgi:hypothetical protein